MVPTIFLGAGGGGVVGFMTVNDGISVTLVVVVVLVAGLLC